MSQDGTVQHGPACGLPARDASYPARRGDLVASARDQGADQVVLDTIVLIPDEEYPDVDAVIIQIIGAG
jgi:hypothetical protein